MLTLACLEYWAVEKKNYTVLGKVGWKILSRIFTNQECVVWEGDCAVHIQQHFVIHPLHSSQYNRLLLPSV